MHYDEETTVLTSLRFTDSEGDRLGTNGDRKE